MKRAIHIYPNFDGCEEIHSYRKANDVLVEKIPPHITLVFPFEDHASNEEIADLLIDIAQKYEAFEISFSIPTIRDLDQVWIEVKEGKEIIEEIHKELYAGFLRTYLRQELTYIPHVTIGSMNEELGNFQTQLESIKFESLKFKIEEVIIEVIDEFDKSLTLKTIKLKER